MKLESNTMYHLDIMELIVMLVLVGVYERWTHVQPGFQRQKGIMLNILSQNKHVTKERGNECGKVGTTSAKGGHGGL